MQAEVFGNEGPKDERERGIEFADRIERLATELDKTLINIFGTPEGKAYQKEAMGLMQRFEVNLHGSPSGDPDIEHVRLVDAMEVFNQLSAMYAQVLEKLRPAKMKASRFFIDRESDARTSNDAMRHHTLAINNMNDVFEGRVSYALFGGYNYKDMGRQLSEAIDKYNETCDPKHRIQFKTETL